MKDRLLGMSLSYNRVRDSLIDPLVREEVFFQGDPAFGRYVADGDMPFQIVSVDGFEAVRNVVENTSPYRVQDRELTVTLRAVGDGDPEAVLRKYLEATNTETYSLNAQGDVFYVPFISGGRGMVYLNLFLGDGDPLNTKRYQALVSIRSMSGNLFKPSDDVYSLTFVMHDQSFISYDNPYRVEWSIPYLGGFVSDDGLNPLITSELPIFRLENGLTDGRLSRPRITVEMTAVDTANETNQSITVYGYFSNPTEGDGHAEAKYHNRLYVSMYPRIGVNTTDNYLNVGETASMTLYDPYIPTTVVKAPRHPIDSTESYFYPLHDSSHMTRGYEHMNFPVSDGATIKIYTQASFGNTPGAKGGADVKIKFDFFEQLTGVVI